MDNWCVFCGQPIEDVELYCDKCTVIVQDLTPEQRQSLEKFIQEEEKRKELAAALDEIKETIFQAIEAAIRFLRTIQGETKMDNKGKFHPGTQFRANVSGVLFEVVKIENNIATIRDTRTGMTITYGLRALEKCDVTILEVR